MKLNVPKSHCFRSLKLRVRHVTQFVAEKGFGFMPVFCNNTGGVFTFNCFIIASSTRPAASASDWAWWWLN
jgi:hypothetical protein